MTEFFVKAIVTATIEAATEAQAQQALCDRLPDLDRYTVHTVDASQGVTLNQAARNMEIDFG